MADRPVDVGSATDLRGTGRLLGKLGAQPVCVVWHEDRAYAVDDRCPHLGFPLHRGSVQDGLLTCHWHHARFDLASGATLDPFADDVRAYRVDIVGDRVLVAQQAEPDVSSHLRQRLREGLEQSLTLVTAKAVLGLLDAEPSERAVLELGIEFGTAYRRQGWGAGLTVLTAMGNLLPHLSPDDRALALVHGLAFVARDTSNRPPRFPLTPLGAGTAGERLAAWYRRFIETRADEAAERTLATAISGGTGLVDVEALMMAAATDHLFIDEGHTVDFTNKAFEAIGHLGGSSAAAVLPTLVLQTAQARRSEEGGAWRYPHDLAALVADASDRLDELVAVGAEARERRPYSDPSVAELAWALLGEDPREVMDALCRAVGDGASPEQLGRSLAYAAALRILRFHVRNDHGDWDIVHHGFTYANALHQSLVRAPATTSVRGVLHGAMKVYLDRFLNVPAARLPSREAAGLGDLGALAACWDTQGEVDEAGRIVYQWVRGGGTLGAATAALGHALLAEDAEFHWYQTIEAAVRQATAWGEGTEEAALILAAAARFLAAHTPTRRELPQIVRTAQRLSRGEALYEEDGPPE
jgi:nitrite reductase/ring-hydroxylating ferredoxin subunit